MPTQTQNDFRYQADRAAGLAQDATCACRAAGHLPLPPPHRRLLNSAIRKMESAQQDLFEARNNPWLSPTPKLPQLELL